jgi:hypothetical protein
MLFDKSRPHPERSSVTQRQEKALKIMLRFINKNSSSHKDVMW